MLRFVSWLVDKVNATGPQTTGPDGFTYANEDPLAPEFAKLNDLVAEARDFKPGGTSIWIRSRWPGSFSVKAHPSSSSGCFWRRIADFARCRLKRAARLFPLILCCLRSIAARPGEHVAPAKAALRS